MQRHRHQEFIRFLNVIEKQVPAARRSTPSSTTTPPTSIPMFGDGSTSSAMDAPFHADVGVLAQRGRGFFATLTKRRLKRGVFRSVVDLQAAINRFLEDHNQQSQPFTSPPPRQNHRRSAPPSVRFPLGQFPTSAPLTALRGEFRDRYSKSRVRPDPLSPAPSAPAFARVEAIGLAAWRGLFAETPQRSLAASRLAWGVTGSAENIAGRRWSRAGSGRA